MFVRSRPHEHLFRGSDSPHRCHLLSMFICIVTLAHEVQRLLKVLGVSGSSPSLSTAASDLEHHSDSLPSPKLLLMVHHQCTRVWACAEQVAPCKVLSGIVEKHCVSRRMLTRAVKCIDLSNWLESSGGMCPCPSLQRLAFLENRLVDGQDWICIRIEKCIFCFGGHKKAKCQRRLIWVKNRKTAGRRRPWCKEFGQRTSRRWTNQKQIYNLYIIVMKIFIYHQLYFERNTVFFTLVVSKGVGWEGRVVLQMECALIFHWYSSQGLQLDILEQLYIAQNHHLWFGLYFKFKSSHAPPGIQTFDS